MGLQQQIAARGILVSVGVDPAIRIVFQYNPAELTDKRTVTYSTINTPGAFVPNRQYTQGGDRTITFSVDLDGLMEGPVSIDTDENGCITPELNKYRAFVNPQTNSWQQARNSTFADLYADVKQFNAPPTAIFVFGDMAINCVVTDLSITEKLFDPNLGLLRAKVAVTLIETIDYGNQPTSPPGA
jgi:hypothetical protein